MVEMVKITNKENLLIDEIIKGTPHKESYFKAGYTGTKNIDKLVYKILNKPKIKTEIQRRRQKLAQKSDIKGEQIINELKALALSNITDIINWDEEGKVTVRSSAELPQSVKKAIKKIKHTSRSYYEKGDLTRKDDTIELEMHQKITPLEKLGEYLKIWEKEDKKQNNLFINQFVQQIRERTGYTNAK